MFINCVCHNSVKSAIRGERVGGAGGRGQGTWGTEKQGARETPCTPPTDTHTHTNKCDEWKGLLIRGQISQDKKRKVSETSWTDEMNAEMRPGRDLWCECS